MKHFQKLLLSFGIAGSILLTGCQSESPSEQETTTKKETQKEEQKNMVKILSGKQTSLTGVSVHDPSIFKDKDGTYYVFGSHLAQASSKDLIEWNYLGTQGYTNTTVYGPLSSSLAESFAWAGMNDEDCKGGYAVWAPDIVYNEHYQWEDGSKGAYMMFYSTSSTYCRSCIGFGVSKSVEGPFTYVDTLIYSGFTKNSNPVTTSSSLGNKTVDTRYTNTNLVDVYKQATGKTEITEADLSDIYFKDGNYNTRYCPNAIDPGVFFDENGKLWMSYGSWSGGIYLLELDAATGKAIHPTENSRQGVSITDIYFGKKIAGGYGLSGEGPYVLYDESTGFYYLYMSYGYLTANEGYNIRLFRSENPDGPYVDAAGNEATWQSSHDNIGVKVMGSYSLPCLTWNYMAPGHNSALRDDDGKYFLFYHQRFSTGNEAHELRVHQMLMNSDNWPCVLPYNYNNETINKDGYKKKDAAGSYYILKQDPIDNKKATAYNEIVLEEDGTVSGFFKGTWTMEDGTHFVELKIGVATYKGVLCEMKDEAGTDCMVFSAIGDNNSTLWGTKY